MTRTGNISFTCSSDAIDTVAVISARLAWGVFVRRNATACSTVWSISLDPGVDTAVLIVLSLRLTGRTDQLVCWPRAGVTSMPSNSKYTHAGQTEQEQNSDKVKNTLSHHWGGLCTAQEVRRSDLMCNLFGLRKGACDRLRPFVTLCRQSGYCDNRGRVKNLRPDPPIRFKSFIPSVDAAVPCGKARGCRVGGCSQ